jgi:hypothetical protein
MTRWVGASRVPAAVKGRRPRLSADPRIEQLELRHELERVRARWHFVAWAAIVLALTAGQVFVGQAFAIPLALAAAALGVAFDRWQSAGRADEGLERNIRALTTIYHESPRTIRRWLTPGFIDDSIRNLLAAALDSEDLGHGYWEQAVKPFLRESQRGYKAGWRYQIDVADLRDPVPLMLDGRTVATMEPDAHRRLHTTVSYTQQISDPPEMYYVAAVFEGRSLPAWFKRPNFLLREVVDVPAGLIDRLRDRPQSPPELPGVYQPGPAVEILKTSTAELAATVLSPTVVVGEQLLEPSSLHIDAEGISWGFRLDADLRERLRASTEICVDLETFMSRRQRSFPVVIAAPTRNPVVQFNYGLTDIAKVETSVFFSAERPWDAKLRTEHDGYRRIDVLTEMDDWVFAGSGCIFAWCDDGRPSSSDVGPTGDGVADGR